MFHLFILNFSKVLFKDIQLHNTKKVTISSFITRPCILTYKIFSNISQEEFNNNLKNIKYSIHQSLMIKISHDIL